MAHLVLVESTVTAGFEVIRAARKLGHHVTFIAHSLEPYLVSSGAEEALSAAARIRTGIATADADQLLKALTELHDEFPVDGILTLSEGHLLPTTRAAVRFGIPFESADAVSRLRDKHTMRTTLRDAKVPQPDFRLAASSHEALAAAFAIGFPVVVKPADGFSSVRVGVAQTPEEVRSLSEAITSTRAYGRGIVSSGLVLVEKFVPGPIISCEVVTVNGQHLLYGCVDRRLAEGPYPVEMGGCFPADLPRTVVDEAVQVCTAALDAVGLRRSFSHTELVLGPDGPEIIEVNGRLIGGLVPTMMNRVLGRSIYDDVISLALGGSPQPPDTTGVGCITAITASVPGFLRSIDAEEARAVSGVRDIVLHATTGQHVRPAQDNGDRLGFVITTGTDAAAAREAADIGLAKVRVRLDPDLDPDLDLDLDSDSGPDPDPDSDPATGAATGAADSAP